MEPSNEGTAEQQWLEARAYWNTLRSLWAIQAQNRDVIDPALTRPTPGELAKSMKFNIRAHQTSWPSTSSIVVKMLTCI